MRMRNYLPNPDFLRELQGEDDDYVNGLTECAQDIRERAHYVKHKIMPKKSASSDVVVEVIDGQVSVANTDHGAAIDEYGSVNSPAYSPMRTAVSAAGFRLEAE